MATICSELFPNKLLLKRQLGRYSIEIPKWEKAVKKSSTVKVTESTMLAVKTCQEMVLLALRNGHRLYELGQVSFVFRPCDQEEEGDGAGLSVQAKIFLRDDKTPHLDAARRVLPLDATFVLFKVVGRWTVAPEIRVSLNSLGGEWEFRVAQGILFLKK
ncbi:MAG: hypothetical protein WC027_03240 [Candidatus Paceibacterota bacterium]